MAHDRFRKLTHTQHILERPEVYTGSVAPELLRSFVWEAGSCQRVSVEVAPALLKLFDELVSNAADNRRRDASQTYISVAIGNRSFGVENDGATIPIVRHPDHANAYVPSLIFGELLTGSNFDAPAKRSAASSSHADVAGRFGYGAKLANIFSRRFMVEVDDAERQLTFRQTWTDNMSRTEGPAVQTPPKRLTRNRVCITAHIDTARFGLPAEGWSDPIKALFRRRVVDMAAVFAGQGLSLRVDTTSLAPFENLLDYVRLYACVDMEACIAWTGSSNVTWSLARLKETTTDGCTCISFANSVCTYEGGTHVNAVWDLILNGLKPIILRQLGAPAEPLLKVAFLKSCPLFLCINATTASATYDGQEKRALKSAWSVEGDTPNAKWWMRHAWLVEMVGTCVRAKLNKGAAATLRVPRRSALEAIPKLEEATSKPSVHRTLILTEGDSAKATAMTGLRIVGSDLYGVFPLRGKLLNVRDMLLNTALKNAEIQNLLRILGLEPGVDYANPLHKCNLRYGHVMIMTDADEDGAHIAGLLMNLFATFWPSLLRRPGFLQRFVTPLVKVGSLVFYNAREYKAWRAQTSPATMRRLRGQIKYYKGLGTSSVAETLVYFRNLGRHVKTFDPASPDEFVTLHQWFGKSKEHVDRRRERMMAYLEESGGHEEEREEEGTCAIDPFFRSEFTSFGWSNVRRAIPAVEDGLKPSQRKVLAGICNWRPAGEQKKVAQFASWIAAEFHYHHGEASMVDTVVKMAQNYVGSNNVSLLQALGQFGTRSEGGADAASPRYTHTLPASIVPLLFPPVDTPLLECVEEDGQVAEPVVFAPVIPFLLLNGAEGIGTGWATSVPCFNPLEVLACVRRRIMQEPNHGDGDRLVPWYRGWTGLMEAGSEGRVFQSRGRFRREEGRGCLVIDELPVGTWTSVYKTWLETKLKGTVASVHNHVAAEASVTHVPARKGSGSGPVSGHAGKRKAETMSAGATHRRRTGVHTKKGDNTKVGTEGEGEEKKEEEVAETVNLVVTLVNPEATFAMTDEEIAQHFQLTSNIRLTNMNLMDHQGRLFYARDLTEIFDRHFAFRLAMYEKRRAHLLETYAADHAHLEERARFIRDVASGEVVIARRKREDVLAELAQRGFTKGPEWLQLSIASMTVEKAEEAERESRHAFERHATLQATTVRQLWLHDLDHLEAALVQV
jgi:DNA topoisomerase-2